MEIASTNPPRSRLLTIPGELRNIIYEHVFDSERSVRELEILLTCKQIHQEAAALAFATTEFPVNIFHYQIATQSDRDINHSCYVQSVLLRSDALPTRLKPFVNIVSFTTNNRLECMARLFQNGIFPKRITFDDMDACTGRFKDEPNFNEKLTVFGEMQLDAWCLDLPSRALLEANPKLKEVVFRWPQRSEGNLTLEWEQATFVIKDIIEIAKDNDGVSGVFNTGKDEYNCKIDMQDGSQRELKITFDLPLELSGRLDPKKQWFW